MHEIIFWLVGTPPVGVGISADALLPLGALAIGVAIGLIQIYSMSRDKAYSIQYDAIARRLKQCEESRDIERAERDGYRDELADAHAEIADLKAKFERRPNAGA